MHQVGTCCVLQLLNLMAGCSFCCSNRLFVMMRQSDQRNLSKIRYHECWLSHSLMHGVAPLMYSIHRDITLLPQTMCLGPTVAPTPERPPIAELFKRAYEERDQRKAAKAERNYRQVLCALLHLLSLDYKVSISAAFGTLAYTSPFAIVLFIFCSTRCSDLVWP